MNIHDYLEKRAASIEDLGKAYRKIVKPFAQKGTKGQNFLRTDTNDIILSAEGMNSFDGVFQSGSKIDKGKLHKARNILTGLHEGRERKAGKSLVKGFSSHRLPTMGMEDFLEINTLKGFTPEEKAMLRTGLSNKDGLISPYGAQRRAEAKVLGEQMPEYKATFDALVEGKTHRADGTRLLNRHERKKIYKAFQELQKRRTVVDEVSNARRRENYKKLEDRMDNLADRFEKIKDRKVRKKKQDKLFNLWDRIEGRASRSIEIPLGTTDFSSEVGKYLREFTLNGGNRT